MEENPDYTSADEEELKNNYEFNPDLRDFTENESEEKEDTISVQSHRNSPSHSSSEDSSSSCLESQRRKKKKETKKVNKKNDTDDDDM